MVDIHPPLDIVTAATFGAAMRTHLERVEAANAATLDTVAGRMLDVVRADGLIYVSGTGHSIGSVLETFYRAGGLACVQPLYHPSLLPLHGGRASTLCEHLPGLAPLMVGPYRPGPDDLGFVVSNSGINAVPVELAAELARRGTPVVAIVSLTHLRRAESRAGRKIDEIADHVLDTLVPYGDAAYPVGNGVTAAGLSSLTNVYLWNLLLARLIDRSRQAGVELPSWTSSNVAGGEPRNAALVARFGPRVPTL
ncbi:MAG TPA: sugar isomerase domain-containing protein [Acidimicrobiia bacterium]|nr:sugar isomerase domain-containing protein [Acidimicrobiia bacterium]